MIYHFGNACNRTVNHANTDSSTRKMNSFEGTYSFTTSTLSEDNTMSEFWKSLGRGRGVIQYLEDSFGDKQSLQHLHPVGVECSLMHVSHVLEHTF